MEYVLTPAGRLPIPDAVIVASRQEPIAVPVPGSSTGRADHIRRALVEDYLAASPSERAVILAKAEAALAPPASPHLPAQTAHQTASDAAVADIAAPTLAAPTET